ncbi:MAG: hypothetical protein KDA80_01795 [Planctomycetaceae bacterium]|nr:hypothetical protein [Planctomycetaceae bacterium]
MTTLHTGRLELIPLALLHAAILSSPLQDERLYETLSDVPSKSQADRGPFDF